MTDDSMVNKLFDQVNQEEQQWEIKLTQDGKNH
jgi:hypothetical protein